MTTKPPTSAPAREPPRKGEKERKVFLRNKKVIGAKIAVNVVTESLDFIDSLYKGVEGLGGRKCATHDYKCKMAQLYRHWDDPRFDAASFVEAWINNQVEDFVIGSLGQVTTRGSRAADVTTGLDKAVRDHEKRIGEIMEEHDNPLPELTYDPETGKWGLAWEVLGLQIGG